MGNSYFEKLKQAIEDKRSKKIDYDELGNILLGDGNVYSKDNIRKAYYVLSKIVDQLEDTTLTEDDILKKNEEIKTEIYKERKKLQAIKLELNRLYTHDARMELLCENLKTAFETLPVPEFRFEETPKAKNERAYVLGISDIHYGANFTSINNSYSIEECHNRFYKLYDKTIAEIRRDKIENLTIINLGDSIQGILRLSDLKVNEVAVTTAIVGVSKLIASFLNKLSFEPSIKNIHYIHIPAANHTQIRPLGSKASELVSEDVENVIMNYIHDALINNPKISIDINENADRVLFNILDFNCIGLHGHQIRNIKNALKDLTFLHKKFFSYAFLGHLHAGQQLVVSEDNCCCEVIVVPGIVGSDPYSDKLMVGAKSMSQMYVFDKHEGLIETRNLILN